jgi:hypothetical protein
VCPCVPSLLVVLLFLHASRAGEGQVMRDERGGNVYQWLLTNLSLSLSVGPNHLSSLRLTPPRKSVSASLLPSTLCLKSLPQALKPLQTAKPFCCSLDMRAARSATFSPPARTGGSSTLSVLTCVYFFSLFFNYYYPPARTGGSSTSRVLTCVFKGLGFRV